MIDNWDDWFHVPGTTGWTGEFFFLRYDWVEQAFRTTPPPLVPRPPGTCSRPVYVICHDDSHATKLSKVAVVHHDGKQWGLLTGDPPRVASRPKFRFRCQLCHLDVQIRADRAAALFDAMTDQGRFRILLWALARVTS